jgi:hypothetical protein
LEFVSNMGRRYKIGKADSTYKRLPMEPNTRIVALTGGFETNSGYLKQFGAHYFIQSQRICIAEQDRLDEEQEKAALLASGQQTAELQGEELNEDDLEEQQMVGDIYVPEEWNTGEFELNINRCFNCH